MSDIERRFHEAWLGMVQPVEGLVFSVPALVEAQCMRRATPDAHAAFRNWLSGEAVGESGDPNSNVPKSSVPPPPATKEIAGDFRGVPGHTPLPGAGRARSNKPSLPSILRDVLGFRHILEGEEIDEALQLWVPEGQQSIRPTHAIAWPTRLDGLSNARALSATPTDAEHAAQPYATVVWSLPHGLDFDKPETETGEWNYPPAAKFDRLLRHARLPFGLLFNGVALRLVVAPHGESSGALTFRLAEAAETGGRDMLSGLVSVLSSAVVLGPPERNLDWLLRESRRRQADVTNALAGQVFEAIDVLLQGFAAAAERDGTGAFREALERDDEHVYRGLLTSLLRLVFLLYAEDRALMPTSHPLYAEHLSVLGLWSSFKRTRARTRPNAPALRRVAPPAGALPRRVRRHALWRAAHPPAAWHLV